MGQRGIVILALFVFTVGGASGQAPGTMTIRMPPYVNVTPGGQARIVMKVSNASKITVGNFTLDINGGTVTPSVLSVKGGPAMIAAGGCSFCPDWTTQKSLFTNPTLPAPATPPVVSVFALSSGCADGHLVAGQCEAGWETGGISGNNQELACVTVSAPASAAMNDSYSLSVSATDFSNAASETVPTTIVPGQLVVSGIGPGDINADNLANTLDSVRALRSSLSLLVLSPIELRRCDVNGDGSCNALDAVIILRKSLSLIANFPTQCTDVL